MTTPTDTTDQTPPVAASKPAQKTTTTRRPTAIVPARQRVVHDVDWTMAHGKIMAPVNAAGAALCAAMLGGLGHAEAAIAIVGGVVVGIGHAAGTIRRGRTRVGAAARLMMWVGIGAWLHWAWSTDPWRPEVIAVLAAAAIGAGLMAPEISVHEDEAAQRKETATCARERAEVAVEWEQRIHRVMDIDGHTIDAIETWPGETGMTISLQLPAGGRGWRDVAAVAGQLADDADLPSGCTVEVGPGTTRRQAILRVQAVDRANDDCCYPDDHSELSISEPFPIGTRADGSDFTVSILDDPALIVARRGSGKTNLLHVATCQGARCPDVIMWGIDLNGAGFTTNLINPWLEGRASRPLMDWVAATPEEAELMVKTATAIAKRRKTAYAKEMKEINDTKLHPSRKIPMIVVFIDEAKEAVGASRGHTELSRSIEELIDIGRAMRVQVVLTALRAEAMTVPPSMKAQIGTKIVLRPARADEAEVANALGWGLRGILTDCTAPGMALASTEGAPPVPVKTMLIRPDQIDAVAVACADRRPTLDTPSAQVAGDAYIRRWDRHRAWMASEGADVSTHAPVSDDADGDPNTTETGLRGTTMTDRNDSNDSATDRLQASMDEMARARDAMRLARERAIAKRGDQAALDALQEDVTKPAGTREWVIAFLREAGATGLPIDGDGGLLERLARQDVEISRATLYRQISNDPAFHQPERGRWALAPGS